MQNRNSANSPQSICLQSSPAQQIHQQVISSRQSESQACKLGSTNCKPGSFIPMLTHAAAEQESLMGDLFWQRMLEKEDEDKNKLAMEDWDTILTSSLSQTQ
eukprot:2208425-Ditylum_brightwellii.AAC.1